MTGSEHPHRGRAGLGPARVPRRHAPAEADLSRRRPSSTGSAREILRRDWVLVAREEDAPDPGHVPAGRGRRREPRRRPRPRRPAARLPQRLPPSRHGGRRGARAARSSASSARTTPGSTTSRASSSGPSTPRTSTTSASRRTAWPRFGSRRGRASSSSTSSPDGPSLRDQLGDLVEHLERFDFGRLRSAKRIEYDGRRELEVHRRELLRVLPLPGRPPAAQQADAVRPRRRLRAARRLAGRLDGARRRGRDDGPRRRPRLARRPPADARDHAERRAPDLLLRPLADDVHLDPPRLPAAPPARSRRAPDRTRVICDWLFEADTIAHAGLRPVRRGRVLGPDQPPGLARLRAPAARDDVAARGSPAATRTRRRRSTRSTGWSPTATPATRSRPRGPSASATTCRRRSPARPEPNGSNGKAEARAAARAKATARG